VTVKPSASTLARFTEIVGSRNVIRDAAEMTPYMTEWRGLWNGVSPMVIRPGSTDEVSKVLALANETRVGVVPQSGNTGLVGGQIPDGTGDQIVLSLDRMTQIVEVDDFDNTMTVEAGVILKTAQEAADKVSRLLPLSLASEGSCRIGGNLSTNAGGLNVLAYGSARDLCLGVEVVLADGRVWNGLRKLRKDNTGYNLKDLFIGAEGTLGVITAAVLKLFPKPKSHQTALIGIENPKKAIELLSLAREMTGNRVVAFELIPRIGIEFTVKHMAARDPLGSAHPYYVLVEMADVPESQLTAFFNRAMADDLVQDAALAMSEQQRQELWDIREKLSESQKFEGGSIKHDVSVPVKRIPNLYERATAAAEKAMPGARVFAFGHMGDGNIHFNVSQPPGMNPDAFLAQTAHINAAVYDVVIGLGGSISAEHGIGVLKRDLLRAVKTPLELEMMRGLKKLLDPNGILNPGKLLP
jgi:FAD/FMN-containing dehydrogenase